MLPRLLCFLCLLCLAPTAFPGEIPLGETVLLNTRGAALSRYTWKGHSLVPANGENGTLTEVAWRNGYYDYAHMSADFRKICGYAPMTLLRISENDGDEVGWRI